jgi:hypothetical protein
MKRALEAMGFACRILTHPKAKGPFLFAERIENPARPTVFGYGHGDVICGFEGSWKPGIAPWKLVESEGRYWGRGTADNKGQHTINLAALGAVLEERVASMTATSGRRPAVQPSAGGSLPNDVSPSSWSCRPSGCRIPIAAAPSMPPTSTCRPRSPARRSA